MKLILRLHCYKVHIYYAKDVCLKLLSSTALCMCLCLLQLQPLPLHHMCMVLALMYWKIFKCLIGIFSYFKQMCFHNIILSDFFCHKTLLRFHVTFSVSFLKHFLHFFIRFFRLPFFGIYLWTNHFKRVFNLVYNIPLYKIQCKKIHWLNGAWLNILAKTNTSKRGNVKIVKYLTRKF